MQFKVTHIEETGSTNRWLREHGGDEDMAVVADYQTAGRGSGKNTWESERGKNLLLSVLWHPHEVQANDQFLVSMAVSLAIEEVIRRQDIGGVTIKWPNDIYIGDRKVCGMLIENNLKGELIRNCIIGIGLNVNQCTFVSDAPNPTSLSLQAQRIFDREDILQQLLKALAESLEMVEDKSKHAMLHNAYHKVLYRRGGIYPFRFEDGVTRNCLVEGVDRYGRLQLSWKERDWRTGAQVEHNRNCEFHTVQFII